MKRGWAAAGLVLALAAGNACAAGWVTSKSTDAYDFRVDRESIRPAGDGRVLVWSLGDYSALQTDLEDVGPYRSVRYRLLVDCVARRMAVVRQIYFAGHHGDGAQVFDVSAPPEFDIPGPGESSDDLLDAACQSEAGIAARRVGASGTPWTFPGDWVTLASREGMAYRLDRESIQPSGDGRMEAWTLIDLPAPTKIDGKTAASARVRMVIDCASRTVAPVQAIVFAERHGEGSVVLDEARPSSFGEAVSDKAQARVVAQVCPAAPEPTTKP